MWSLPPSVRIFLCTQPTDMRRSFDGLAVMVQQIVGQDPLSGHLFIFCNRRRDRVKLLHWDRDGYWIYYKRLEQGTFRFPSVERDADTGVEMTWPDVAMWLEGVDLSSVKRQHRYVRRCA